MREMNLYLDLTEDELARLYLLARRHHQHPDPITPDAIQPDDFFRNGGSDADWAVRRVVNIDDGQVTYRNIAGPEAPRQGRVTLAEFTAWAHNQLDPKSAPGD